MGRESRKARERATCHQFTVLSGERSVEPFSTGPNRSAADRFRLLRILFFFLLLLLLLRPLPLPASLPSSQGFAVLTFRRYSRGPSFQTVERIKSTFPQRREASFRGGARVIWKLVEVSSTFSFHGSVLSSGPGAKGDGRERGDETWSEKRARRGGGRDDRKRPIFDLTERSRPWLETFPQRAFRRPHPRSLLKSSGGLHRFAIGHGLGRRKERGREPRVSRGRGWRYTKKRWAEWHGKLFLKSRDPSLPRHLSSRSSSRDAQSGINNLTPCRTDKPAPLPCYVAATRKRNEHEGRRRGRRRERENWRERLRKLRGSGGIARTYRIAYEEKDRNDLVWTSWINPSFLRLFVHI